MTPDSGRDNSDRRTNVDDKRSQSGTDSNTGTDLVGQTMENNSTALSTAVKAIKSGEPVVYPTDTVYGLGVDASNSDAIERVFDIKGRNYDNPLSLAVQNISAVKRHAKPSERAIQFIQAFLPGPITVVVERSTTIPDVLTAGRNRVGIRIPDNDIALSLLKNVAPTPVTATSANQSGTGSIVHPDMLDQSIRENAAIVLDGGETTGTESTVVDPAENIIHRRGAMADAVIAWLSDIVGTRPMIES